MLVTITTSQCYHLTDKGLVAWFSISGKTADAAEQAMQSSRSLGVDRGLV